MTRTSTLRLIDANLNRALEGVRVCEEIIRFHVKSPRTFRRLRALRHGIAAAMRRLPIPPGELLGARDSARDLGRRAPTGRVDSLERLAALNLQRAKEALRVLEECARILAPRRTADFQRLRFRAYEIERDVLQRLATLRYR